MVMKKSIKNKKGFALITALFTLVLMSILGLTILGAAVSSFKMVKVDSKSQGAYYIAEAGVNQIIDDIGKKVDELSEKILSHEDFFKELDEYINKELKLIFGYDIFEENLGDIPQVKIAIDDKQIVKDEDTTNYSERVISYKISSAGEIGKSKRVVTTSIEISHRIEKETTGGRHPAFDYVMYSGGNSTFKNAGKAIINGSIYAHNAVFEATDTEINGSIISEKSVNLKSAIKIKGDIYAMDGHVSLDNSNIEMKGDIHATDNVTLSHGTTVNGSIYTNGEVKLKSSNTGVTGEIHSLGNVELGSGANIHNIYTNGNVNFISNGATVNGKIHAKGNIILGPGTKTHDIYGNGYLEFSSNNTVDGNINIGKQVGSIDRGNNITVKGDITSGSHVITRSNNNYNIYGNVTASDNVENGVGNIIYGSVVSAKKVDNKGVIQGQIIENSNLANPDQPVSPNVPNFGQYKKINSKVSLHIYQIGSDDIKSNKNSIQHNIIPGAYNDLILKWNDTIKFTGGNYYFNSIDADNANIELQLDLSNGPINIYTKGDIKFGHGLKVYVSQDGIKYTEINKDFFENNKDLAIELGGKIYWETYKDFSVSGDTWFLGSVLADGNFSMGFSSRLIGAYVINEGNITMGYEPTIIYAPPTTSAAGYDDDAGGTGGSGGEGNKGKNTISLGSRINIINPIREKSNIQL